MSWNCGEHYCANCGDKLIHQTKRTMHESSSVLGQHIHDSYPNQFDFMDLDGIVFKQSTGRLRIIEHKPVGSVIRGSQKRLLPMLARMLDLAKCQDMVHPMSSVLQLTGNPPFDKGANVTRFNPDGTTTYADFDKRQVDNLLQGRPINDPPAGAA